MDGVDFSTDALTGAWREEVDRFMASEWGARVRAVAVAAEAPVYPPHPFRALEATPCEKVRVVIFGQDPYHTPGKAEGLAFSVPTGEKTPPSLRNIFKELKLEYGIERTNASLFDWARQGVLLLNPILTVEAGRPMSHARLGWERLTDRLVERINALPRRIVFLLWGRPAQQKRRLIDEGRHAVLACNHPSPLSAARGAHPFLGSGCFRRANQLLEESGEAPIDWIGLSVKPANSSSSGFSGTESSVELSLF